MADGTAQQDVRWIEECAAVGKFDDVVSNDPAASGYLRIVVLIFAATSPLRNDIAPQLYPLGIIIGCRFLFRRNLGRCRVQSSHFGSESA
jgi:hypothetical protein